MGSSPVTRTKYNKQIARSPKDSVISLLYIKHGAAPVGQLPPRELYIWVFPSTLTLARPLIADGEARGIRIILLLPAATAVGVTASCKRFTADTRRNAKVLAAGEHLLIA